MLVRIEHYPPRDRYGSVVEYHDAVSVRYVPGPPCVDMDDDDYERVIIAFPDKRWSGDLNRLKAVDATEIKHGRITVHMPNGAVFQYVLGAARGT